MGNQPGAFRRTPRPTTTTAAIGVSDVAVTTAGIAAVSRAPVQSDIDDAAHPEVLTGTTAQATGSHIATAVTVVAESALDATLQSATAGVIGYPTGNSEWMHMSIVNGTGATQDFTVWTYNYAFGRWTELQTPLNFAGATVIAAHVPATFEVVTLTDKSFVVPVHGADRVAFVVGPTGAPDNLKIAFNNL
jgi:hypothetical protein